MEEFWQILSFIISRLNTEEDPEHFGGWNLLGELQSERKQGWVPTCRKRMKDERSHDHDPWPRPATPCSSLSPPPLTHPPTLPSAFWVQACYIFSHFINHSEMGGCLNLLMWRLHWFTGSSFSQQIKKWIGFYAFIVTGRESFPGRTWPDSWLADPPLFVLSFPPHP